MISTIFTVLLLSNFTNSLSSSTSKTSGLSTRPRSSISIFLFPEIAQSKTFYKMHKTKTILHLKKIPRGGGTAAEKVVSNDDDKVLKMSLEALESIRSCYNAAFLATAVDMLILCISFNEFQSTIKTWKGMLDFFTSLILFYFGLGLVRVHGLYNSL